MGGGTTSAEEAATGDIVRGVETGADAERSVGAKIGRYVVLSLIGQGGMGMVWRAYDPRLRREVALKCLNPRYTSSRARTRIVREAQAMAQLSHPNVVAVYDVDEIGEQLVLAMEFVPGDTLATWLKSGPRSVDEILRTFVEAGEGLAAAHRAGLLHRDFKPANVLLGQDGRPRVTDFGVARFDQGLSSTMSSVSRDHWSSSFEPPDAQLTRDGGIVGTPIYMAPEQHRGRETDARADQFAFCVSLWRGLVGSPPFSPRAGVKALVRAKEAGPPPWPRHVAVPRAVADAIRRGLAAHPTDRWPSMEALLAALASDHRARRRRYASAAVGVALGIGGFAAVVWAQPEPELCEGGESYVASLWNEERADRVRAAWLATGLGFAESAFTRVAAQLDAYTAAWAAAHRDACEATAVRKEQSAEVLDVRMACLHRARGELDAALRVLEAADPQVVEEGHDVVLGLPNLQRCGDLLALRSEVAPPDDPASASAVEQVRVELAEVAVLERAGKYPMAFDRVSTLGPTLERLEYPPVRAEAALHRGRLAEQLGRHAEAEAELRTAFALAVEARHDAVASAAASALIDALGRQARVRESDVLAVLGLSFARRIEAGGLAEAELLTSRAGALLVAGSFAEAEQLVRVALAAREVRLGSDHPEVARTLVVLSEVLMQRGDAPQAETVARRALAIVERTLGPDHPVLSQFLGALAHPLTMQGDYDAVEALDRRALEIARNARGERNPWVAHALSNLASTLIVRRNYVEAERLLREALAITFDASGSDHPMVADLLHNLAAALYHQGRIAETEAAYREAIAIEERALGPSHPNVAHTLINLAGTMLEDLTRSGEARALFERALTILEASVGPSHPRTAELHTRLAMLLEDIHDDAAAIEHYERAVAILDHNEFEPYIEASANFGLAKLLAAERGQSERVATLMQRARDAFAQAGPKYAPRVDEIDAWLKQHRR